MLKLTKIDTSTNINNDINEKKLPIPFDYFEYSKLKQKDVSTVINNKVNERAVSLSNDHMFINYSNDERLKLYEYAIEQSKLLNFPFNSWNEQSFLNLTQSNQDDKKGYLKI